MNLVDKIEERLSKDMEKNPKVPPRQLYWVCRCCDWKGTQDALLSAPNPFNADKTIFGCPVCKEVTDIRNACDEPNCKQLATCGFIDGNEYRRTCGAHVKR